LSYLLLVVVGLCAILGHVFPVWLKFKGGKAVATSFGVLLAMPYLPLMALGALAVWVIALLVSRYVSVASTAAVIAFATAYFVLCRDFIAGELLFLSIFVVLILVLVIVRHIPNYKRLARGAENRVSFGKKKDKEAGEGAEQ
jgi:glycerol-3-phosphate acyltransferase PlsY